jgi:hypothetical protein
LQSRSRFAGRLTTWLARPLPRGRREEAVAELDRVGPGAAMDNRLTEVDWLRVYRREILSAELLEVADQGTIVT